MSHGFAIWIESVVALLLLFTIATCAMLERRLKRFKAEEQSLKATISELITATEIAERAIASLKETAHDCDRDLGERLRTAERFSADIERQIGAGEAVLNRLTRIVTAARTEPDETPETLTDARAMVAAAQAFAERTRGRLNTIAA